MAGKLRIYGLRYLLLYQIHVNRTIFRLLHLSVITVDALLLVS